MTKPIKQISIFVGNTPGALANISEVLKKCNINLTAFNLAENSEFGILRIIVDDPESAIEALSNHSIVVRTTDVVGIKIKDEPGALIEASRELGKAGINIQYAYAFALPQGSAVMFIRVADPLKAIEVLEKAGVEVTEKTAI